MIVGSLQALIQPIPRLRDLQAEFVQLASGDVLDVNKLLARLVKAGYTREPLVEAAGQVSLRGDILDVFPFAAEQPLRVELFEDEIESLRTFDPVEQRSTPSASRSAWPAAAPARSKTVRACRSSTSSTASPGGADRAPGLAERPRASPCSRPRTSAR